MKKAAWIFAAIILAGIAGWWLSSVTQHNVKEAPQITAPSGADASAIFKQASAKLAENKLPEALGIYERLINEYPDSKYFADACIACGDIYVKQGNLTDAKKFYLRGLKESVTPSMINEAQKKLWDVNLGILFSPLPADDSKFYTVNPGDNLNKIARQFNTTVELLQRSNRLKNDVIFPAQKLKVCTAKFSIVIDRSQNTLALKAGEDILKIYKVATGKNNRTPLGAFTIINKLRDPVWFKVGAVVPSGSPENLLGTRWLGISKPGYGIHGTTNPQSIGNSVTEGCVRMTNQEVEELFVIVPVGAEVTIVD